MGKSTKPTRLLVSPEVAQMTRIKELALQGHEVVVLPELDEYDVVLGRNCWAMDALLEPYLDSHTMPEARKRADLRKKAAAA